MNDVRVQHGDGDRIRLAGELNANTVPALLRDSDGWLNGSREPLQVDLAGIERADSAGVAFLLDMQRRGRGAGRAVHFANAPDQMRSIIGFCALQQVLAID